MATVWMRTLTLAEMGTILVPYLRDNFTWAGGTETSGQCTYFYINEAKTIGIRYFQGTNGIEGSKIAVIFNGSYYHETELYPNGTFEVEITATALILSYISNSNSISATNCEKIIICNAHNNKSGADEQIMIYLASKSSSNVSAMYASDVAVPANMSEQNSNANTNAKTTNLIPFYSTASEFITTDIFKSLCEDIGAWYFGNVMVNNKAYRMSGSVFALDE